MKLWKLQYRMFALIIFLSALCPEPCSGAEVELWAAPEFTYDINSMIQLNPDFSTYPDYDGVIWLKQVDYGMADEGGVERRNHWIILGRAGLDQRWLSWNLPVPDGGKLEIIDASVHSPGTGEKIMDVTPFDSAQSDSEMRSVVFSGLPDEFILVLSYREIFPEQLSIDGLVWLSEQLPVWEAVVNVTVPSGHSFYHSSSTDEEPEKRLEDDRQVYTWRAINTTAEGGNSMRISDRAYAAFSAREGSETMARILKELEEGIPAVNMKGKKEKDAERAIENILKWFHSQPGLVLPAGQNSRISQNSQNSQKIPEKAPWTNREKILLAYRTLKDAGTAVRLFWQTAYRPAENEPACSDAAFAPVLAITSPKDKKAVFYCDMEQTPRFGENSASLAGRTLYGVSPDGKLEERKTPNGNAAENRLNFNYKLRLDENGVMTGTFNIKARGAWRSFLFPKASKGSELELLMKTLFLQFPRCTDLKFTEARNESELSGELVPIQSILGTGGDNILTSLPPLAPRCLAGLSDAPLPYELRFPFILDTRFTLALPRNTANVPLPVPVELGGGKVRYTDSYKLGKNKVLTAESRLNAGEKSIADNAADFGMALRGWQNFTLRPLPVQLRRK